MAKFVFVDDDVIDRSLEPVIRIGWDGFKWNKGYSLLHYAADCVTDPEVVELMANLATDVDQKDDYGLRPIDYARKTQDEAVIKALERMPAAQNGNQEAVAALQHHLAKAEERAAEQAAQAAQQAEQAQRAPMQTAARPNALQVQWADGASAERPASPSHASPADWLVQALLDQDMGPDEAQTAIAQLDMIFRLAEVAKAPSQETEPPVVEGKGKGKGPAKGTSAAPAAEGAKAAEDTDSVPEVKAEERKFGHTGSQHKMLLRGSCSATTGLVRWLT
eukprot:g22202.t1